MEGITINYGNQPFADLILAQRVAYSGSNAEYIGYAPPGASDDAANWMICKFGYDESDNLISKKWASGNNFQDKVWDNRESYVYS